MRANRYSSLPAPVVGAAVLLLSPQPGAAQSNAELMAIIREQQRQIEELSRKVDALQDQVQQATERAGSAAATAEQVAKDTDMEVSWGPSPTFKSKDGRFEAHVRGRLFVDGGYLDDEDGFYSSDNATELRAARLGVEGKAWQDFGYRLEVDFADDDVDITDAYIEYDGSVIEPAFVRVGQFKTPNSLEEQTSARFITFMERAAFTDAFDFDRRIGLGSGVGGDNWAITGGLFGQNAEDVANDEGYALAGRGHYALLEPFGSNSVIHLGASGRLRNLENDADSDSVRYRQRPFFHFTDTRSVDTGDLADAENDVFAGPEAALVVGPFSVQAEAGHTWLQRGGGAGDADGLWGAYLSASYFLTGESRNYDAKEGVFDRVKVDNPVFDGGPGAWELGARFDYIDLNDNSAEVRGGEQYTAIAGVNWYLNNNVRFMLDYALTNVYDARDAPDAAVDGSQNLIQGVGARAQVDF
jgi:phosphate-selective porin OprO/OprP